jgi:hypothetical protein
MVRYGPLQYSLGDYDSSQGCDFVPHSSSEFGSPSTPNSKRLTDWEIEAAIHGLRGQLLKLEFERDLRRCDLRKAPPTLPGPIGPEMDSRDRSREIRELPYQAHSGELSQTSYLPRPRKWWLAIAGSFRLALWPIGER